MAQDTMKLVAVGNGGVGKTCLLITYALRGYPASYVPTVFDNYSVNVSCDDKEISIGLWDTAGGEDYHRLRPLSYVQADTFLVCFSTCSRKSFDAVLAGWYPEIRQYGPKKAKIILVGTKSDIRRSKEYLATDNRRHYDGEMDFIELREIQQIARKIGAYAYVECSSYKTINVDAVFEAAIRAHFGFGPPKALKASSSTHPGFMSALKKKVKNITMSAPKDMNDDRLVTSTPYNCEQYNRFGHASVYGNGRMFVFGGYKNENNEMAEYPWCWKGENMSESENLHISTTKFTPRAYLCATLVHTSTSSPVPSATPPPPLDAQPPTSSSSSSPSNTPSIPSSSTPRRTQERILIFGGKSNGYLNDLLCFNPETQDMEQLNTTGKIPSPRYGMSSVSMNDEMYVFGGYDNDGGPCNDCYKFNIARNEWSLVELTGAVPSPRFNHAACCAPDLGLMILHGGKSGANVLDDMYSINLLSGECRQIPKSTEFPGARQNHTCTYTGRGSLVLVGGITKNKTVSNDVFLFSLETQKWVPAKVKGPLPRLHSHSCVFVESEAELWLCGGKDEKEKMHSATKLHLPLSAPRIYDVLPLSTLRDILRLLPPTSLYHLCEVNKRFRELASDKQLWNEIVTAADPHYDPTKDGDAKAHYAKRETVWYNDFRVSPTPPPATYIQPGAIGWRFY